MRTEESTLTDSLGKGASFLFHDKGPRNRLTTQFVGMTFVLTVLFLLAIGACGRGEDQGCLLDQSSSFSTIILTAEDGTPLCGRVYGSKEPPFTGNAVVLAHGWAEDQSEWNELAESLLSRGYLVLTFSFRGHGLSGGERDPDKLVTDLEAALDYLRSQEIQEWLLIGSGTGATATIHVADNASSLGVVLLSVSSEFEDMNALGNMPELEMPKLLIVTEQDFAAHSTSVAYFDASVSPRILEVFSGDEQGIALLRGIHSTKVQKRISDFLEAHRR